MAKTQGAAAKGPGPGRPKGARNKITRDIQQAIVNAFEKAGGENYLARIAEEDPKTFCALLGKVLPMQVAGDIDTKLTVEILRLSDAQDSATC